MARRAEKELPLSEFRVQTGAAVLEVVAGTRVILTRHGKPIAAIVPLADLAQLRGKAPGALELPIVPEAGADD